MEKLLTQIVDITNSDHIDDADKAYIIREVILAFNAGESKGIGGLAQRMKWFDEIESSKQVPGANEAWYDEKYLKEQKEAAYDHGYRTGHVEGYNKGLSEFKDRWRTHGEAYTNGYNLGKDERSGYDYANGHADGYSKGLEEGKKWCEEQLKAAQDKYAVAQAQFVSSNNRLGALQADYTQLEKKYEEIKKAYKEMDEKRGDAWSRGYDKGRSHGRKWVKDEIINILNNFNEEESE